MLVGVDPILTGRALCALDEMGHGDMVVISDAHFTAVKLAKRPIIDLPGIPSPRVLKAIRRLLVPDDFADFQLGLMAAPGSDLLDVQKELVAEAKLTDPQVSALPIPPHADASHRVALIDRYPFYDLAATAELIIRTGETRTYGNALFFKGVTPVDTDWS